MKHIRSFAAAVWWVLALAIAGLFLMIVSDKDGRISETENRTLQGFPSLTVQRVFSGEFMAEFDAFLSDSFFERDGVVQFTENLLGTFSMLSQDETMAAETAEMEQRLQAEVDMKAESADAVEVSAAVPGVTEVNLPEAQTDEADDAAEGESLDFGGAVPITENHSYLWYEMTDGTLKSQYTYDRDKIATYADTLRIMQSYLPDDGVICFTQVPLASIANRWVTQQSEYCGWGSSVEMMLEDCLEGTQRIMVFSTYDILEPYVTGDTPMFYSGDHHWTAEGAYLVAAEMFKAQGLPVIPYEEYAYKHIRSEKGKDVFNVLYPLLPVHSMVVSGGSMEEISLMNYNSVTYRSFMNNTRLPWRRIYTGANTGRKCLVLCDSFGNAFTPYLLPYYDEVHMADFRNGSYDKAKAGGSIGDLITYYGIDDVYIIVSTANGLRKDNSIVYLRKYLTE